MRDLEDVLGDLGGHDVAVVAFGDRHEPIGVFDSGPPQDVGVGAVADHLITLEVPPQHAARRRAGERVGIPVDDDDLVAGSIHVGGDLGADPSATNDHELQSALITGRHRRRPWTSAVRCYDLRACAFPSRLWASWRSGSASGSSRTWRVTGASTRPPRRGRRPPPWFALGS